MGYRTQFVKMSYELAQMLPESDSTYIEFQEFRNTFGKDGNIIVVGIDNPNLYELNNFNAWYDLTQDIKNIQVNFKINGKDTIVNGVTEVLSVANVYSLKRNKAEKTFDFDPIIKSKPTSQKELDSLKAVLFDHPFYNGYLFKDSSSATLMAITIDTNVLDSKYRDELFSKVDQEVLEFENNTSIEVHKSGYLILGPTQPLR